MDLWATTIDARASLLATFEELDEHQWAVASLCSEWTIKDLLAHLILAAKPPAKRYIAALVRSGGSFDRANARIAAVDSAKSVDALLTEYRGVVEHRFSPPGWPQAAPLSDILLHSLDVRIPLGIEQAEPPERYEPVMNLLFGRVGRSFTLSARPNVRWVATDIDWAGGSGAPIHGRLADLALTAAGRNARLDRLTGDGREEVQAWLSESSGRDHER